MGLGRVNLNDLSSLHQPGKRRAEAMAKKKADKPKVVIQKRVDRQTMWAACRATIFGTVLIGLGMAMAGIGYYAHDLAIVHKSHNETIIDKTRQLQFQSLSYVGPVIMGVGAL